MKRCPMIHSLQHPVASMCVPWPWRGQTEATSRGNRYSILNAQKRGRWITSSHHEKAIKTCSDTFAPTILALGTEPPAFWASRRKTRQSVGLRWLRRSSNIHPSSQGPVGTWMWARTDVNLNPLNTFWEREREDLNDVTFCLPAWQRNKLARLRQMQQWGGWIWYHSTIHLIQIYPCS